MLDCSEIRPLLSAFGDGELEPPELLRVARHLAGCSDCEREVADFSLLRAGLRDAHEASLNTLPLAGFTEAVQARIVQLQPSLLIRLKRWFTELGEQVSPAVSFGSVAVAIAVLTALVVTPYIRDYLGASGPQVAMNPPVHQILPTRPSLPEFPSERAFVADSRALISRLESENPAVAVWSEPHTDTTVIWLPDQQPAR